MDRLKKSPEKITGQIQWLMRLNCLTLQKGILMIFAGIFPNIRIYRILHGKRDISTILEKLHSHLL